MQQILLFADGFRETTQRLFYFITDTEIEARVDKYLEDVRELFTHKNLYAKNDTLKHRNEYARDDMIDVLKLFRSRFKSHYDLLTCDSPTTAEACVPPEILRNMYMSMTARRADTFRVNDLLLTNRVVEQNMPTLRRQISGESSIASARLLTGSEKTAAPASFSVPVFEVLIKLCEVPAIISLLQKVPEGSILQAIIVDLYPVYMVTVGTTTGYAKLDLYHVTGFLKCNGKWFYYDNETGIYPVDKELIEYLVENMGRLAKEKLRLCIKIINRMVWFLLIKEIHEFEDIWSSVGNNQDNYEIHSAWYDLRMNEFNSHDTPEYKYLKSCIERPVTIAGEHHTGQYCYNYVTKMNMVTLPATYVENQEKTAAYVTAGQMITRANNEIAARNQEKANIATAYRKMMEPYESAERRTTKSRRRPMRRKSIRRRRPMKN